jgi:hypothetical protein
MTIHISRKPLIGKVFAEPGRVSTDGATAKHFGRKTATDGLLTTWTGVRSVGGESESSDCEGADH